MAELKQTPKKNDDVRAQIHTVWADALADTQAQPMTSLRPSKVGEGNVEGVWRSRLPQATFAPGREDDLAGRTLESDAAEPLDGRTLAEGTDPLPSRALADTPTLSLGGRTFGRAADDPLVGHTLMAAEAETIALNGSTLGVTASVPPATETDVPATDRGQTEEYRIEGRIAAGGMGDVFRARQLGLDRIVALKRPLPGVLRSPERLNSFVREALVTGELEHPNIIPIYQNGLDGDGRPYYAMKLVRGIEWSYLLHPKVAASRRDKQLAKRAAEKSESLTLQDHLEILLKVCDAVAFAHSRYVVHRDLKPENVMVGEFGEVQVMDWGLAVDCRADTFPDAKALPRAQLQGPGGTPAYMAPEMALGISDRIEPRTDVYLLGAILYELLTGYPPHKAATLEDALLSAADNQFSPPEEATPVPPRGLCEIARRALSADPADRHPTVQDFQNEISLFQKHEQSMRICEEAQQELNRLTQVGESLKTGETYVRHAEVVAAFRQALRIWEGNAEAQKGLGAAYRIFVQAALTGGDLGLARAQLDEFKAFEAEDPSIPALEAEWQRREKERRSRQRRYRLAVRATAAMGAAMLLGGVVSWWSIKAERDKVVAAQSQVLEEKKKADENAALAIKNADLAVIQQRLAETKAKEAEDQTRLAKAKEEEASREKNRAEKEKERAEAETRKANEQRREAVANLARIDIQRARLLMENDGDFSEAALSLLKAVRVMGDLDASEPRRILELLLQIAPRIERTVSLPQMAVEVSLTEDDREPLRVILSDGRVWPRDGAAAPKNEPKDIFVARRWGDRWIVATRNGRLWSDGAPLALDGIGTVSALATDDKGERMAVGDNDGRLIVFQNSGKPSLVFSESAHKGPVTAIAFLSDDRMISSGADGRLCTWGIRQKVLIRDIQAHAQFIRSLSVSADGQYIATGGGDGVIRIWSAGALTEKRSLSGHSREVGALAFHPFRSDRLASQGRDGTVRLWDWSSGGGAPIAILRMPGGGIHLGTAFSPDGNRLACLASDRSVQIWDVRDRVEVTPKTWRSIPLADARLIGEVAGRVAVASRQKSYLLPFADRAMTDPPEQADLLWVGPAGSKMDRMLAMRPDGTLSAWDASKADVRLGGRVGVAAGGGNLLAVARADGQMSGVRLAAEPFRIEPIGKAPGIVGLTVSEAGLVAAWTTSGELYSNAGGPWRKIELEKGVAVRKALWRPGESALIAAGGGRDVLVIDAKSGQLVGRWQGHASPVSALALDRKGATLASGDDNGQIRLWDLRPRSAASSVFAMLGAGRRVAGLQFDDSGVYLTCTDDLSVHLLAMPSVGLATDLSDLTRWIEATLGIRSSGGDASKGADKNTP